MFTSEGIVYYKDDLWVTTQINQDISDYYLSLIPKCYRVTKPRWPAHVTVVRPEDNPIHLEYWKKHEGERVTFVYDPTILEEKGFWWFNLWCKTMEEIRLELGLSIKSRVTIPPSGYFKCFHCTIGNNH